MKLITRLIGPLLIVTSTTDLAAQGQDSSTWERDLMVIAEMLPGRYDNQNQSYFNFRLGVDEEQRHKRLHVEIKAVDVPGLGQRSMLMNGYWNNQLDTPEMEYLLWLALDDPEGAVRMFVSPIDPSLAETLRISGSAPMPVLNMRATCELLWRREAAQFVAEAQGRCADGDPSGFVLSYQQLWVSGVAAPADSRQLSEAYQLHRARGFECYADIPGVGGGRDVPYERYEGEGFKIHDRGGAVWFDTNEDPSRQLGISLFLVDWPINNYEGIFTRDSLVIYVNEQKDGETINHGYSFTQPDAERIGINLKWLLAMCYMKSNAVDTPSM